MHVREAVELDVTGATLTQSLDAAEFGFVVVCRARCIAGAIVVSDERGCMDLSPHPWHGRTSDLQISSRRVTIVHPAGDVSDRHPRLATGEICLDAPPR